MNGYRVTLLPLLIALLFDGLWHSLLRFVCVIIVPIDCEFSDRKFKFIGVYVYVDGLGYRFIAAAIL